MYKLTDRRLEAATPILLKYQGHFESSKRIDPRRFEQELRECWGIGYQELKDLILDMSKRPVYERIAAYYMQHQGAVGPVSEFKARLAELYGIDSYDRSPDREAKAAAYWAQE